MDAYMKIQDHTMNEGSIPDAIICAADALTYGAIDMVSQQDMLGKVLLTGQDAELDICKHIIQGNVLMTVYKSNKALAYTSAEATWKLINNEEIKYDDFINNKKKNVPSVLIPPVLITKETINELIKEGIYTKDQLYE